MPVAAGARMGESECKEGLQVRKGPGKPARLTAEVGSSPALSLSSPEPWREVGDAPDGRVPPVSVRVREKGGGAAARAVRAGGLAGRLGPSPSRPPALHSALFLFLFCLKMFDI
jgi:hypothetical protein